MNANLACRLPKGVSVGVGKGNGMVDNINRSHYSKAKPAAVIRVSTIRAGSTSEPAPLGMKDNGPSNM